MPPSIWSFARDLRDAGKDAAQLLVPSGSEPAACVTGNFHATIRLFIYSTCIHLIMPPPSISSALPEQHPSPPHSFSPTLGYTCGPVRSARADGDSAIAECEYLPIGLRHARLRSTPSSCYSEWDSSAWHTWSSVTDSNMASARTSLISSADSCYTDDSAHLARLLAAAAETMSAASLSGEQRRKGCYWPMLTTKSAILLCVFVVMKEHAQS